MTAVGSASDALAALDRDHCNVALCDVRMPGMTGMELLPAALRKNPELAVVMLTAVNDAPTATEALALGASDYLVKPVELVDLQQAVERALHRRSLLREQSRVERLVREEVVLRPPSSSMRSPRCADLTVEDRRDAHQRDGGEEHLPARPFAARRRSSRRPSPASSGSMSIPSRPCGSPAASTMSARSARAKPCSTNRRHSPPMSGTTCATMCGSVSSFVAPLRLDPVLDYIQDHHEQFDSAGYPRGLAGEAISLGGRILAAADSFDALTSRRAYREPLHPAEAIELLEGAAGARLDPSVFRALRSCVLRRRSLTFIE